MNIYALRDRLLDHWLVPFAATTDKDVLSAIAYQINKGDPNAIAQAPHHYEIHRLAKLTEDGRIIEDREFLAECASLVRGHLRKELEPGEDEAAQVAARRRTNLAGRDDGTGTSGSPLPGTEASQAQPATQAYRDALRGN